MAPTRRNLFASGLLLLTVLGCNMPVATVPPTAAGEETATATASGLQEPTNTAEEVSRTVTPSRTPAVTASASPSGSATATITPTYSVPMLTVIESTNCRSGPGENYEVIITYLAGKQLEIAGHSDSGDFWLVKSTESPTGTCWLWGEFVKVTGSHWTVPSVTAPPTASAPPPGQVILENWEFFCSGNTITVTISWFDREENEAGYRVFRDGEAVAELPASTTTYTETAELLAGQWAEYYIQVHGPTGSANSSIMRMTCG